MLVEDYKTELYNHWPKHGSKMAIAIAKAYGSPGVGGRNHNTFRLGAAIFSKSILFASGHNSYKTHPKTQNISVWPHLHAEQAAIFSLGMNNCKNKVMYVARVMKNGHIGLAMPCSICQKLIKTVSLKVVYYSCYKSTQYFHYNYNHLLKL